MSRNRYQLLLAMIHFSNNEDIVFGNRTGKIQPLLDMLQKKFQALYCSSENIVIDETLVPWRGSTNIQAVHPQQSPPLWNQTVQLCSTKGYTWSLKIYAGKSGIGVRETGLAHNICIQLAEKLLNQERTLFIDNFYTSYELARSLLLAQETHMVGTLRANKKNVPKEVVKPKLKKGECVSMEEQHGIVVLMWKESVVPVNAKNTTDSAALDQSSQIDAVPVGHNSNTN